ncbi:MAG: GAF domain-containing protein [Chloroflexi bacterium]|nr:GAF domain-containing protein [Chloroflexota bacterium]MBP7042135.1 GAF domain-containing protein [Chloroflexota bacterium]
MTIHNLLNEKQKGVLHFGGSRMALLDVEAGFWGLRRQIEALIGERLASSVLQQAGANGGASFAESFGKDAEMEKSAAFSACVQAYQTAGFGQFEITTLEWPLGRVCIRATNAFEAWIYRQKKDVPRTPICSYSAGVFVGFVNILGDRQDVVCIEHSCQARGDETCVFELIPASQTQEQQVVSFSPDPGLGRQLNLLEMLFERMPMGIVVIDRQYRIQRYNPTWDDFSANYAPPTGAPLAPGVCYFDHLPGTEAVVQPMFDRTLAGETVRQNDVRLESGGIITYWDVVMAPLVEENEIVGILVVSIDTTERAGLRHNLEARVSARTRELQMLLDVAATANSSLNLKELLTKTLDLLVDLIGSSRAGVSLVDDTTGKLKSTILRPERLVDPEDWAKMLQAGQTVIDSGEMMYIAPDVSQGLLEPGALLPLQVRDRKLGVLAIIGSQESTFTTDQLALFKSIADQLSVAIENAYLFEKVEDVAIAAERNRLARDLHDAVTQTLFSASLIADVLPRIWERDVEQGKARLEELRELTRGALAEMRTLLLELRPATLTESSLAELLRQLTQAIGGRSRMHIALHIEGERPLPPETQVALYRITQEALNNITKYAGASQVVITLTFQTEAVRLSVGDNGRGFNPADIRPHSLGLGIMRERAQKIGAVFTIESRIGEGTVVTVDCPMGNGREETYA